MQSLFMLPIITPVITSNTTQFENCWSQIVYMRSIFNFHRTNKKSNYVLFVVNTSMNVK